jgi:hypothetical protein
MAEVTVLTNYGVKHNDLAKEKDKKMKREKGTIGKGKKKKKKRFMEESKSHFEAMHARLCSVP